MIQCQICNSEFGLDEMHTGYENNPLCSKCYYLNPNKYGNQPWLTKRWILNLRNNNVEQSETTL